MTGDLKPLFGNVTRPRRRRAPWAIAIFLVALIAASAVPVPTRVSVEAQLSPSAPPLALTSPRAGQIAALAVKPGTWVEPGQVLVQLDVRALSTQADDFTQQLASLDARIAALERRGQTRSAKKAAAALARAQRSLATLQSRHDRLLARHARRSAARLGKKLASHQRAVTRAQRKLDRLTHADALARVQASRVKASAALDGVKQALARSNILAATPGVFESTRHVGDAIDANGRIGSLVDTRALIATLSLPAGAHGPLRVGAKVTLHIQAAVLHAKIDAVAANGRSARVQLANLARALPAHGVGAAEVEGGRAPLYARWL